MSSYRTTMRSIMENMYLVEGTIDKIKDIVSKKSASKIDGVMVDMFTASAISQIYDKVNDANKKKMEKLPINKLAALAMKMMKNEYVPEEVDLDLEEGKVVFDDHDADDTDFVKLIKKHGLKAKSDGDDTTVTGSPDKIEKVLQTIYGNDWKDMYTRKGQNFENFAGKETDLDEAISGDQYYYVDPKGVVAAVGNKDAMRKMNMKQAKDGNKGGSFSQNLKKYKVGDKIKEEADLDEASKEGTVKIIKNKDGKFQIQKMTKGKFVDIGKPHNSAKEAEKFRSGQPDMFGEQLAKIKGKTPGDKGRKAAVEDDIERAEKKGDKKEVEKLKEADLDENFKTKKLAMDAAAAAYKKQRDPSDAIEVYQLKDRSFVINHPRNSNGRNYIKDIGGKLIARVDEEFDLDEKVKVGDKVKVKLRRPGGTTVQDGKVIKIEKDSIRDGAGNKRDSIIVMHDFSRRPSRVAMTDIVKEEVELDEASARSDAKRSMSRDRDLGKKDDLDKDDFASDDDVKAASKNIMMQLRKASNRASRGVVFGDKKKVMVDPKIAQAVAAKYNTLRRPADKEKFQMQIAKSYKDMLSAIKESTVTESKFGIINKQLKGEK